MGEEHFLNLQPGTIVNGRYEIVKCLGTGSMGMVYACRHRELAGHLVAMKVLFSEVARDSVAAQRFRNEIVASYGVSHPNVVRAYEYFRDGDLIAFTMEYIGGGDLADRISADETIPIEETVRMLSQMCSGVQAIHDAGIVHRDLKPENILLTPQGDIKITDFGIARQGGGPRLTEHGGVVGTIDYVSPEYLEKSQVDARSDIYAMGVLAYEMITRESPFKGQSLIETMTMRLRTDPRPPHELRPECSEELSNIVLRAMVRDPDRRYQTGSEMLYDLQALNLIPSSGVSPKALPSLSASSSPVKYGPGKDNGGTERQAKALPASDAIHLNASKGMNAGGLLTSSRAPALASNVLSTFDSRRSEPLQPGQRTTARPSPIGRMTGTKTGIRNLSSSEDPRRDQLEGIFASRNRGTAAGVHSDASSGMEIGEEVLKRIAISQPHLSLERVQKLSGGFQAIQEKSTLRSFVLWGLILFTGFGVGLFALSVLKVWFFNESTGSVIPSHFEH